MKKSVQNLSLVKKTAFYIWTLRNHDCIISRITSTIWLFSLSVIMLGLTNVIEMKAVMGILFMAGGAIGVFLWVMIERRRSFFLKLKDRDLRKKVHEEMLLFIRRRQKRKDMLSEKIFRSNNHG